MYRIIKSRIADDNSPEWYVLQHKSKWSFSGWQDLQTFGSEDEAKKEQAALENKVYGFSDRLYWYILLMVACAGFHFGQVIIESSKMYVNDKSAFAWIGFLPFILPIFLMYGFVEATIVAAVVESVIGIRKFFKKK